MGALKLYQRRAGTIRRVVRVSGHFVCGLCRNPYAELRVARGCLEQCWDDVLALDPVLLKKYHGQLEHRCRFCARDYLARDEAERCAEECMGKSNRKAQAEAKLGGAEERPLVRQKFSRKMLMKSVVPVTTLKKKLMKNKVETGPVDPVFLDAPPVEDGPAGRSGNNNEPIVDRSVAAGVAPKKPKPSDIFYRDGAKYVCQLCHKKYFTKLEVTDCWEAHE